MNEWLIIPKIMRQGSFKDYLFRDVRNRRILWMTAIAVVLQFTAFKYMYPYASYINGDSFAYLETALYNLDINTYMVGYSRFLRFFSVFARSDIALTAFQYLLIESSALFFLFSLFYFYTPSRLVQAILLFFVVLNPLFLHLANLVSSDGCFLALSLIWFGLLVWMIHRPTRRLALLHVLVLFLAVTVRYNALIYPVISILVISLSRLSIKTKALSIVMAILSCVLFVIYTGMCYKKLIGTWQYSPFSGWQIANNAMYAYRYVDSAERKPVPDRFRKLDNMIRAYFDTTRDVMKHPQEAVKVSTIYMWDRGMPMYKYRDKLFETDTNSTDFRKWAFMGDLYRAYGMYIIEQYPLYYMKYFLWPNAVRYYAPSVEFLAAYNMGAENVDPIAQIWFGYKSTRVSTRMKSPRVTTLNWYPILAGSVNIVFVCGIIFFFVLRGFKREILFRKGILLAGTVWLINAGFTIFSSPAALRFQSFPILVVTTFALLLIDWMFLMMNDEMKRERRE